MSALRAVLGKDVRLLKNGVGLVCLLLPLALLVSLRFGMSDLAGQVYLEPFPIAVRDEDNSVMSRSLLSQMAEVELFSEVIRAEDEDDAQLLDAGCAGVVTLPKDFFYTLYDMRENPVQVVLNGETPLEASVLRSVFTSVMEIISADQAAARGVFHFCYGELNAKEQRELWSTASSQLIRDALSRQTVFDDAVQASDLQGSVERGLLGCAVSVLCLFFCLAGVKTLPEEMGSGVLPRFLAAGGSPWTFILSKLLATAALTLPAGALLLALQSQRWPVTLLLMSLLFVGAFGLLLFVAVWAGSAGAAQRWGNVILLLSLMLGGAIYPRELLPEPAQALGPLTLPYYARRGLECIYAGGGVGELMGLVWPVPVAGLALGSLAVALLRRTRHEKRTAAAPHPAALSEPAVPAARRGRVTAVAARKTLAMSGGRAGLVCVLVSALLCGALTAQALSKASPDTLRLAVVVEGEEDPLARELARRLDGRPGMSIELVPAARGERLLLGGSVEGVLTLGRGYDRALEKGEELPLRYSGAASAVSAQAAREIIAGQVAAQRAVLRGLDDAQARLDRPLAEDEREALLELMAQEADQAPPLYEVEVARGSAVVAVSPFAPSPLGFAALAVMLTVLTWGAWVGSSDQRLIDDRMASLPGGRGLAYISSVLALDAVALGVGLCALLPGWAASPWRLAALVGYVHCVTALVLAVTRYTAANGRMDTLACFIALITCLVGGCFADLSQLSPALQTVSLFTPQGLALRAGTGQWQPLAALAAAGCVLLWLGRPPKKGWLDKAL